MQVNKIMNKDVVSCSTSCTARDIASRMKDHHVGAVLILEDGGDVKGIVTDRDIALNVVADSKDPATTPVTEFMTSRPYSISSNSDMESALKMMNKQKIRRLPVVENGKVVGLLSWSDLAVELKEEFDEFMDIEQSISKSA